MDEPQPGPQARPHRARRALTPNRLHISYLFRHSSGIWAERSLVVPCDFRAGFPAKAVSNRKQTAVGSQVGMRVRDWSPVPVIWLPGPPSRVWAGLNWPPGLFPETNVISGFRLKAGSACALSGRQNLRPRASKG